MKQAKKLVASGGGVLTYPKQKKLESGREDNTELKRTGNALDSSAPNQRRGKEREVPRKKKPSALRKVSIYNGCHL